MCPKHISDQYVFFCHDPLSHLAVNTSSCMKLMQHTRTDSLRFGTFFKEIRSGNLQVDESLRKICG